MKGHWLEVVGELYASGGFYEEFVYCLRALCVFLTIANFTRHLAHLLFPNGLVRWDLHQLFVAVDYFTGFRVGDASTISPWINVVRFYPLLLALFGYPLFGCFRGVCQSFIYHVSFDKQGCVGMLNWGRAIRGDSCGGAGGGVIVAPFYLTFGWVLFFASVLFANWHCCNSSSIWHLIGIFPILVFLQGIKLSLWISLISVSIVLLEARLALVCLCSSGINCGLDYHSDCLVFLPGIH